MKLYNTLFVFLLIMIISCSTPPDFVGSWELSELQLGSESITGEDIGNPSYVFNADKTFSIEIEDLVQTGTWKLEGDKLSLLNDAENAEENVLHVIEVNDSMFHYTAGVGEELSKVYLRKK